MNHRSDKHLALALGVVALMACLLPEAASAQSLQDLLAKYPQLRSVIAAHLAQGTTLPGVSAPSCVPLTQTLRLGSRSDEVRRLQLLLNQDKTTQVSLAGVGSPGKESTYFGPATRMAVMHFQNKYSSEVLVPYKLSAASGVVGSATRTKLNAICVKQASAGQVLGATTDTPFIPPVPSLITPANNTQSNNGSSDPTPSPAPVVHGTLAVTDNPLSDLSLSAGASRAVATFDAMANGTNVSVSDLSLSASLSNGGDVAKVIKNVDVLVNGSVVKTVDVKDLGAKITLSSVVIPLSSTAHISVRANAIDAFDGSVKDAKLSFQVSNIDYVDITNATNVFSGPLAKNDVNVNYVAPVLGLTNTSSANVTLSAHDSTNVASFDATATGLDLTVKDLFLSVTGADDLSKIVKSVDVYANGQKVGTVSVSDLNKKVVFANGVTVSTSGATHFTIKANAVDAFLSDVKDAKLTFSVSDVDYVDTTNTAGVSTGPVESGVVSVNYVAPEMGVESDSPEGVVLEANKDLTVLSFDATAKNRDVTVKGLTLAVEGVNTSDISKIITGVDVVVDGKTVGTASAGSGGQITFSEGVSVAFGAESSTKFNIVAHTAPIATFDDTHANAKLTFAVSDIKYVDGVDNSATVAGTISSEASVHYVAPGVMSVDPRSSTGLEFKSGEDLLVVSFDATAQNRGVTVKGLKLAVTGVDNISDLVKGVDVKVGNQTFPADFAADGQVVFGDSVKVALGANTHFDVIAHAQNFDAGLTALQNAKLTFTVSDIQYVDNVNQSAVVASPISSEASVHYEAHGTMSIQQGTAPDSELKAGETPTVLSFDAMAHDKDVVVKGLTLAVTGVNDISDLVEGVDVVVNGETFTGSLGADGRVAFDHAFNIALNAGETKMFGVVAHAKNFDAGLEALNGAHLTFTVSDIKYDDEVNVSKDVAGTVSNDVNVHYVAPTLNPNPEPTPVPPIHGTMTVSSNAVDGVMLDADQTPIVLSFSATADGAPVTLKGLTLAVTGVNAGDDISKIVSSVDVEVDGHVVGTAGVGLNGEIAFADGVSVALDPGTRFDIVAHTAPAVDFDSTHQNATLTFTLSDIKYDDTNTIQTLPDSFSKDVDVSYVAPGSGRARGTETADPTPASGSPD